MRRARFLELVRGVVFALVLLVLYGLAGNEDYHAQRRANGERAWSVAQWETSAWGPGR